MLGANFGGDAKRILAALQRSVAIAEYDSTGKILSRQREFLPHARLHGPEELIGKSQSTIVDAASASSIEYREFWAKLARGEADAGEYRRAAQSGKDVWLQSSYAPVLGGGGKVLKIVEIAVDITDAKRLALESAGKLAAISRAHSVIEYSPEAKILDVNERFLKASGYTREKARSAWASRAGRCGLREFRRIPGILASSQQRRTHRQTRQAQGRGGQGPVDRGLL